MKKLLFLLLTAYLMVSCSDPNARYVKKAIRIMDKHGLYAQGPEWEKAKEEALAAQPASLEEAQKIVMKAGTVAGGKHTFLMTTSEDVARTGEVLCDDPIEPNNPTETPLEDALQWIQDQANRN